MATNGAVVPEGVAAGEDRLTALPLDVLECILMRLDKQDLTAAALSCRVLYSFITSDSFILRMLRQHLDCTRTQGLTLLQHTHKWRWCERASLCYMKPFARNLLKEGSAEQLQGHVDTPYGSGGSQKLTSIPYWRILSNGGDGWQVERPPIGADVVPQDLTPYGGGCYVTSYTECCKEQIINFRTEFSGSPKLMDHIQPLISVSEWVAGRHDCDSHYRVSVELLSRKGHVLHSWGHSVDLGPSYTGTQWVQVMVQWCTAQLQWVHVMVQWCTAQLQWVQVMVQWCTAQLEWVQVSHQFRNYGRGVAALRFRHLGRDRRMWAGWYGSKMTAATVMLSVSQHDDDDDDDDDDDPRLNDSDTSSDGGSGDEKENDENYHDEDDSYLDHDEDSYDEQSAPRDPKARGYFATVRNFFKF
ncbi:F-box domain [Trinorchestia longiramus]|nr:F-box domain [Trinorchestia longiramus]